MPSTHILRCSSQYVLWSIQTGKNSGSAKFQDVLYFFNLFGWDKWVNVEGRLQLKNKLILFWPKFLITFYNVYEVYVRAGSVLI